MDRTLARVCVFREARLGSPISLRIAASRHAQLQMQETGFQTALTSVLPRPLHQAAPRSLQMHSGDRVAEHRHSVCKMVKCRANVMEPTVPNLLTNGLTIRLLASACSRSRMVPSLRLSTAATETSIALRTPALITTIRPPSSAGRTASSARVGWRSCRVPVPAPNSRGRLDVTRETRAIPMLIATLAPRAVSCGTSGIAREPPWTKGTPLALAPSACQKINYITSTFSPCRSTARSTCPAWRSWRTASRPRRA